MKKLFFIGFLAVIFIACSSPERDGRRASQNFCDCNEKFERNLERTIQNIVNNFASQNFATRVEARQWSDELMAQVIRVLEDCIQKAEYNYRRLKQRYIGNREQTAKFEYAFRANRKFSPHDTPYHLFDCSEIAGLISTIIPPKPDLEKIKRDLVGRRITPQVDGYYARNWFWDVQNSDIRDIQIMNESRRGSDYWFQVRLILQRHGGAHEAVINLTYVLPRYADDWQISFQENISVNFVRTGQFCNCIRITRGSGGNGLGFYNQCDVALVVGGAVLKWRDNQWHRFHVTVEGNNRYARSFDGQFFSPMILDYRISFIERP